MSAPKSTQTPPIFDPNNRFFYDDLLEMCMGSHKNKDVTQAISASVAYITTKSGMWIRKKEANNGSVYFEFAPDLNGISSRHKITIQYDDDGNTLFASHKLKDLLLNASIKKIRYNDVIFRPYPPSTPWTSTKYFNLFLGFKAQPATKIDRKLVTPILRHILEVWCDNNEELAKYIISWLAFLVQKPDQKPGTAILMRSPPRCGKNILTDFIGEKVLGRENFLSTTRLHDVMGRFNGAIRAKKLVVLNECDMTGSEWHGANNQLKSLITEGYISVEEKGIDVKVLDDFAGYMILSNHNTPIRIELGDERFVALDVSARYKGNRDYFKSLLNTLNDPNTASSFMALLLSHNITDWNARDLPNTRMKWDLMEASMPNSQRFINQYIDIYWPEETKNVLEISCKSLYEEYVRWCQENGEPKVLSSNKFGMEIKQFVTKTRPRSKNRIPHYQLDKKEIEKKFNEGFGKSTITPDLPKKLPPPIPSKPDRLKVVKSSEPKEVDPASIPLPESPKIEPVSDPQEDPIPIERSKEDEVK